MMMFHNLIHDKSCQTDGHDVPVASLSPRQHRLQSVVSHSDALDPFWHRWNPSLPNDKRPALKKK